MRTGRLITIEGPEGAGKSTQAALLARRLEELGFQVLLTREPGGTRVAESIRQLLLDRQHTSMSPRTEFLLYAAARAQHVSELIIPALQKGSMVISDRFSDSSMAYQGYGRALEVEMIAAVNDWASLSLEPDLTLVLDVEVREGLKRTRREKVFDRLEKESLDFHRRVREGFLKLAAGSPDRIKVVEAGPPLTVEMVFQKIIEHVLQVIPR